MVKRALDGFYSCIYFWAKNLVLFPKASVRLFKKYFAQIFRHSLSLYEELGKAGGHEPPLFLLPCHILAFFSSGSHEPPLFPLPFHHIWLFRAKLLFYMVYLDPLKCDFKNPVMSRKKAQLKPFFQFYLRLIVILCVEFWKCFTMQFLTNFTEYCILKYHKV